MKCKIEFFGIRTSSSKSRSKFPDATSSILDHTLKMSLLWKIFGIILLLSVEFDPSWGQTCTCILEDSTKYADTYKWNCLSKGLVAVPQQCWDVQAENVTEVNLASNFIGAIGIGDFDALTDLKDIHLEINNIESFVSSAFSLLQDLRYLNLNQNSALVIPNDILVNNVNLEELYLESTHIGSFPDLLSCVNLKYLEARSCNLGPLARPTFGTLVQQNFTLNLYANNFVDVAADILLPIPSYAILRFDATVIIWAVDIFQQYDIIEKNWDINLDLDVSLKVCDYDGTPEDPNMC